jgi:uncharacterized peroxidase-related enzyme
MSRLHTPASIDAAPAAAQPLLETVRKQLSVAPNMFRVIASSPAALEGYMGLNSSLAKGELDVRTRARIALAVSEANGCDYCLSAHTYLAKNLAKLDDAEIGRNRGGGSADPKADAAVRFALLLVRERGHVTDADLAVVKVAGFGDGAVVEIVLHVALTTLTNYVNVVAGTEIDFPRVTARQAA